MNRRAFLQRVRAFVVTAPVFAAAFSSLDGCSRRVNSTAKDAGARAIRVVSLSPSTTETLFAIGAGPLVVGRSRFCDTPPEVKSLPAVGGYTDPNFEAIFALSPTLVVGARGPAGPRIKERLDERGIATFFPETESIAQIQAMIVGLGRAVEREDAARAVAARAQARIEAVARAIAGKTRPRVLLLFDVEPVVAAGPKSFPDDLLAHAGGANVIVEGGPYPTVGMERVMALDPDVVLDTTAAANHSPSRVRADAPGWSRLRAVREGRVVAIADESVLRPGPRIADAVERLAAILHPEELHPDAGRASTADAGAPSESGSATTSASAMPIAPAK